VVLPMQQRRAPSSLHRAGHYSVFGALEVLRARGPPILAKIPPQCLEASLPRRSDGGSRTLGRPPSVGAPTDGSSTKDGRDGSMRYVQES